MPKEVDVQSLGKRKISRLVDVVKNDSSGVKYFATEYAEEEEISSLLPLKEAKKLESLGVKWVWHEKLKKWMTTCEGRRFFCDENPSPSVHPVGTSEPKRT